uniref:SAP domain-containing protein n=1 Tax=Eutreptiella gymnastica TaxID=73025 RepID=A0A7S4FFA4_9EUGL
MVPEDGLVPQHTISKACATLEDQAPSRQRTSHERPSPLLCTTPQQSVASEQCIASEQCSSLSQAKQLTTSQQPIAVEQCPTADPDAATEHKTHPEEHASESDLGFDSDSDPPPGPSQRTRFHESSQSTRKRIEQTLHLAIVVGKDQDPVVSAEWLQEVGEDMLQSDAAVGKYIALKHPHIKVTILKPRLGDITKLAEKLQGCDAIHILESEQFLGQHNYKNYRTMFEVLHRLGPRLVPSLSTMQYIMTKVDYINLMDQHNVPHVPTFVLERPTEFKKFEKSIRQMVDWIQGLDPVPLHIITKPSHSGSKLHFQKWFVAGLRQNSVAFATALRRLFVHSQKPFVLVQPFIQGLADLEYRLFFVNRAFVSCVSTQWRVTSAGKADMKRCNVDDKALLPILQSVAQRIVDVLPADSVMYRVDMFKHEGRWAVNEIEMVDGDMMPEFHDDDSDIIQRVADAIVKLPVPVLGLPSAKSLLPVIDSQPELDVTAEQWRSVAGIVKTGLKDVERLPENLRDDQRGPLQEWIDILPQLLDVKDMKELCEEWGLEPKGTKRELAAAVGHRLMQEEETRACAPPPKKKPRTRKEGDAAAPADDSGAEDETRASALPPKKKPRTRKKSDAAAPAGKANTVNRGAKPFP